MLVGFSLGQNFECFINPPVVDEIKYQSNDRFSYAAQKCYNVGMEEFKQKQSIEEAEKKDLVSLEEHYKTLTVKELESEKAVLLDKIKTLTNHIDGGIDAGFPRWKAEMGLALAKKNLETLDMVMSGETQEDKDREAFDRATAGDAKMVEKVSKYGDLNQNLH